MANASRAILLLLTFLVSGCIESRFQLSPESRLPKWFEIPNGMSRDQVTVRMTYYTGEGVVFELYEKDRFFPLREVKGVVRDNQPLRLKITPAGFPPDRPSYVVVTVKGVTDIVEHRVRGPVFNMTDDPDIWQEFNVHLEELVE